MTANDLLVVTDHQLPLRSRGRPHMRSDRTPDGFRPCRVTISMARQRWRTEQNAVSVAPGDAVGIATDRRAPVIRASFVVGKRVVAQGDIRQIAVPIGCHEFFERGTESQDRGGNAVARLQGDCGDIRSIGELAGRRLSRFGGLRARGKGAGRRQNRRPGQYIGEIPHSQSAPNRAWNCPTPLTRARLTYSPTNRKSASRFA